MDRSEIEQKAHSLLKDTDTLSAPVNVELAAHRLGLSVTGSEFTPDVSGFLTMVDSAEGETGAIVFNSTHSLVRQRFTIAHELGHYCLHRDERDLFIDKKYAVWLRDKRASTGEDLQEVQANQFAAAMLMPKISVKRACAKIGEFDIDDDEPLRELAELFQVSMQAMSYRLSYVFKGSNS